MPDERRRGGENIARTPLLFHSGDNTGQELHREYRQRQGIDDDAGHAKTAIAATLQDVHGGEERDPGERDRDADAGVPVVGGVLEGAATRGRGGEDPDGGVDNARGDA